MTDSSHARHSSTTSTDTTGYNTYNITNSYSGGSVSMTNGGYMLPAITSGQISITNNGTGYNVPTITLTTASLGNAISWPSISGYNDLNNYNTYESIEWEDCFPDWDRIQDMCEEYPALKIAFEKLKTVYKLVKDHYDTPEDERPIP
jgi:hypothetical protein